jgi:hypothetical protein
VFSPFRDFAIQMDSIAKTRNGESAKGQTQMVIDPDLLD